MWHLLSEINLKKLHAILGVQKSQSKREPPRPILQLSSLLHLFPWFSNFHNLPKILVREKSLDTPPLKERRKYYVVPFSKAKFESKESSRERSLMDEGKKRKLI